MGLEGKFKSIVDDKVIKVFLYLTVRFIDICSEGQLYPNIVGLKQILF